MTNTIIVDEAYVVDLYSKMIINSIKHGNSSGYLNTTDHKHYDFFISYRAHIRALGACVIPKLLDDEYCRLPYFVVYDGKITTMASLLLNNHLQQYRLTTNLCNQDTCCNPYHQNLNHPYLKSLNSELLKKLDEVEYKNAINRFNNNVTSK